MLRYANPHGIDVVLLYPKESWYKLDSESANNDNAFLIEVDKPEPEIKKLTAKFSKEFGIPWLPSFPQQIEANKLRAYFFADYCSQSSWFNWHCQALSTGYGIFGFYHGLNEIEQKGRKIHFPKLLGIQQEAVVPFARYLQSEGDEEKPCSRLFDDTVDILEPTLFRTVPPKQLLQKMKHIADVYGGTVSLLLNNRYFRFFDDAQDILNNSGIFLTKARNNGGKEIIMEQAGLISVAGLLNAINNGIVKPGESALVAITGGARRKPAFEFKPQWKIGKTDKDDKVILIGQDMGLDPP